MRNYNQKTHTKPLVQNSFRKSQRQYPQSVKIQKKLIQKTDKVGSKPRLSTQAYYSRAPTIPHHDNISSQKYFLTLQQPYAIFQRESKEAFTDQYCLWFRILQKQPNKVERKIKIKKVNYVIADWAQDTYPSVLFICVQGIWGYLNPDNTPSKRIVALKLVNQANQIRNGVQTSDLIYQSNGNEEWQIPQDLTSIYLFIQDEYGQKIMTPLPNPLIVELQITTKKI